jgi:hypothetical protein
MTPENLTCPYCNASLVIQPNWSAGQRIVCPRCGDAFPLLFGDSITDRPRPTQNSETAITAHAPTASSPSRTTEVELPRRWQNRLIAGIVLGVMLVMAGGGLAFMLMTQQQRRAYDTSRPPRRPGKQPGVLETEVVPQIANIAPDKLAGLGYLPSEVNFLFAARIPELLATPIGTQVLRDPIKVGDLQLRLEILPRWLGFHLEDLDHFIFAAHITDAVLPPFYILFRTAQPYDAEELRQRLNCTRVSNSGKKKLYVFRTARQDIQMNAWFADERTVVLSLFADQLEALPTQPVEDLQHLPQELRTVLKERREPVAPIWIAGHSSDWSKTTAGRFLNRMKKDQLGKLASIRTFGIWFVPENSLVVKGVFGCKDESGARNLESYFRSLRDKDATFKTALDGPWLSLQFQTDPDFLARLLKR